MSNPARTKQMSCGVDWLTLTSRDAARGRDWSEVFDQVAAYHAREGFLVELTQSLGYVGKKVGPLFVGRRSDGYMARVSGGWADSYGKLLQPDAVHCTRIDIQVTAWYDDIPSRVLAAAWDGYKNAEKRNGRPAGGKFIAGVAGIQTVNLGARQSENFFRIYDKFMQSQDMAYMGAIRFEQEVKGHAADAMAAYVYRSENKQRAIKDLLAHNFTIRGVETAWRESEDFMTVPSETETPDVFQKLKWLREGVAPTVRRMIDCVGLERVIQTLFGATAAYLDKDEVERLIVQYLAENSQECEKPRTNAQEGE